MREVVLYIAMSLDGYVADETGGVDWLEGHGEGPEGADSYSRFIREVDTVIMGRNTYRQVTTQLSPERWVYQGLHAYVVTHRPLPSAQDITFTAEHPCALIRRLRQGPGKSIWICGGPSILSPLMEEDLIDRYHISVIPTILGSGIRLFGALEEARRLRLLNTQASDGIVELIYRRR